MAGNPQNKPVTGYPAPHPPYPSGPTATAYPYPAPPPYYQNHPLYPPPPPYNSNRNLILRRLITIAVSIFIIIIAITFIFWLILRPTLPDFSITSASVSPINTSSSSQLTANWDLTFSVRNPNKKMNIYYDQIDASVFYGSDFISLTSLPPFYQSKENITTVRARLAADSAYIGDGVVSDIAGERSHGAVSFNFKVIAWVRFRSGAWRTRKRILKVFCDDVKIAYANATAFGTLFATPPRQCEVDL
ncbi:NDR1/HIN1-like protein 26 [Tasmannia lanceolata]|uniref:NDR1/HIN1-like protein 26 n=1 Tax=Tasmannia lanceolata TaxID=3420 RepID=UPI0040644C01